MPLIYFPNVTPNQFIACCAHLPFKTAYVTFFYCDSGIFSIKDNKICKLDVNSHVEHETILGIETIVYNHKTQYAPIYSQLPNDYEIHNLQKKIYTLNNIQCLVILDTENNNIVDYYIECVNSLKDEKTKNNIVSFLSLLTNV
jgi:hypothetical protein